MKNFRSPLILLALFAVFAVGSSWAQKRTKTIDFEDQLVEGVNKQPLDSLSQISEDKNKNDIRLYRKRAGFRDLMTRSLEEVRDLQ